MARINIEDTVFKDKRFTKLCIELGSRTMALGALVEAFMVSQEYATPENPECLVPLAEWQKEDLPAALFETGWAEMKNDQVYVRGSKECHAWLIQKRAAGSKGGQKKKKSATSRLSGAKRKKAARSGANPLTLTPTLTPTPSSNSSSLENSSNSANPPDLPKSQEFIAAYCEKFKARWKENPQILGKHAGIAKRLAKDLSLERFIFYLDAYFSMPDAWLVKTRHPLEAFESKLNEIVVFAQSGEFTTMKQARDADSSATNALLLQKIRGRQA